MSTPDQPGPDPATTPDPPTAAAPTPRSRWRRPRSRLLVVGAAALVALVVAGVVAALVLPHRDRGGRGPHRDGAGIERTGGAGGRSGPDGARSDGPGHDGPGRDGVGLGDRLGDDPVVAGTVVSVGADTLVLTPDGATTPRTLRTDDDTRVRGADNAALGDLAAGERVVVRVEGTGDAATAVAVEGVRARVTGTVTALSGNSATVVSVEGLTVTADVTALGQKPAVGDVVVLTGTATGDTISADSVRVLPRAT